MAEMKDKLKGFMKKVNTQFSSSSSSSSSGKFKGQGRVLGSSSSGSVNPIRPTQTPAPKPIPSSNSKPVLPSKPSNSDQNKPTSSTHNIPKPAPNTGGGGGGFDPYGSYITSSKVSKNGFTLNVFECPICGASYGSEEEVSIHVETCVNDNNDSSDRKASDGDSGSNENDSEESTSKLEVCVGSFLSGKPQEGSIEVIIKLLRNIVKEPGNDKFRKIRMSNPRIREAIGDVAGGVELLEFVGFVLKEEGGEMWAAMELPKEDQISLINKAIMLLEPGKVVEQSNKCANISPAEKEENVEPKKIDRKVNGLFAGISIISSNPLTDSLHCASNCCGFDSVQRSR